MHGGTGVIPFLKRLVPFGRRREASAGSAEALRAAFKARYHSFKLLLNANNKALEIMSDMEGALRGNRPFGMSFVRANSTAVSVNVFRIVKNMEELAPGKYSALLDRFNEIRETVNGLLADRGLPATHRLCIPLDEIDKEATDAVGSKMANLGEIRNRLGLRVPNGFVISSLAYGRFMESNDLQTEIDRRVQAAAVDDPIALHGLSADLQQLIIRAELPRDVEAAIDQAYRELERQEGAAITVSMRSSALAEDSAGLSFAGQYRSELNVSREYLMHAYKEIVASKYSVPAMAYRFNRGVRDEEIAMGVGCMVMVHAVASGVMYSRNPIHIRDDAVHINSVWGLPKSVVDGSATPDLFVVSRGEPMAVSHRDIRVKERQFVCYPEEGVCRLTLTGEKKDAPSLTDEQAVTLARMAVRLEEHYQTPQDIEWAIGPDGELHILQSRPLRQREGEAEEGGSLAPPGMEGRLILQGGATASPGVACGSVFRVEKEADALRFPQGAVLAASQALPRWAALLNRAAGVVTEQGSVTGHLANVAREFQVPALFGVPGVMVALAAGQTVTLDAEARRIYDGCVEALLSRVPRKPNLMEGSPVHETLKRVAAHIIPLNLIDPDGLEFRPQNCRTFHDITRFCHEKAVQEMFAFGKEHRFPERSSKQLVCGTPMQWWILNLDDGYREEVEGRFVDLDNIASVPMLAIWEGITAVPWEGPPPVDTRGFMSVMMQATTNPSLDPSMRSQYANRNYFMISRNFCSLTSRFGFHFSTIEALVGPWAAENYISFQFKGGAADYPRRVARSAFVGDILGRFGFHLEMKEDAVFARIEGLDEASMKIRLRVLGYLIIHTRQLDMIMGNGPAVAHQRERILNDLETVVTAARASPV
jgi:pyruvate,water dikinase